MYELGVSRGQPDSERGFEDQERVSSKLCDLPETCRKDLFDHAPNTQLNFIHMTLMGCE